MKPRTTVKDIVLTAIHFRGVEHAKQQAEVLAYGSLTSVGYVRQIIKKYESGEITIKKS